MVLSEEVGNREGLLAARYQGQMVYKVKGQARRLDSPAQPRSGGAAATLRAAPTGAQ